MLKVGCKARVLGGYRFNTKVGDLFSKSSVILSTRLAGP